MPFDESVRSGVTPATNFNRFSDCRRRIPLRRRPVREALRVNSCRARRTRRCCVYENTPGPGFHLLVVDDDGGLILVEQVIDFETAVWLARLVNKELAKRGSPT
jgi:hypothetical protein